MDFSVKQRAMRALRGLTQVEMQELTKIPNTYFSLIESGTMEPKGEWLEIIKSALSWPPEPLAELAFGILEGSLTLTNVRDRLAELDLDSISEADARIFPEDRERSERRR